MIKKLLLNQQLLVGECNFSPMLPFRTACADGSRVFWNIHDAIVIKAISLVLTKYLKT
ncbi:MAG: hypothetical protein PHC75_02280 [Burkholderiales bacterium]|nr:hypothetical protein [Burkholderiales bacterium]